MAKVVMASHGKLCNSIAPNASTEDEKSLQAEIMAFEAYMTPTPKENDAYKRLTHDVQRQARKTLPDSPIEVIGSHRTGLATSLSDLDFRLLLPKYEKSFDQRGPSTTRPKAQKESIRKLKLLHKALAKRMDIKIWNSEVAAFPSSLAPTMPQSSRSKSKP
jgi:DNA polymerase sigma